MQMEREGSMFVCLFVCLLLTKIVYKGGYLYTKYSCSVISLFQLHMWAFI